MDAILLTLKSYMEKLTTSDCFRNLNYLRYEEGAKLCLCENGYRKLKNYVDYLKHLECQEIIDNYCFGTRKTKDDDFGLAFNTVETLRAISMLIIIQTEDELENLNFRKITTNSSYTEINDKVKLLKSKYPMGFAYSARLRRIKYKTVTRNLKDYHLLRNLRDRIIITCVSTKGRYKIAQQIAESEELYI